MFNGFSGRELLVSEKLFHSCYYPSETNVRLEGDSPRALPCHVSLYIQFVVRPKSYLRACIYYVVVLAITITKCVSAFVVVESLLRRTCLHYP